MSRYPLAATILFVPFLALAQSTPSNVATLLQQADRRAWLTDWNGAMPLYVQAEKDALKAADGRNALYAKFGRLRGQMQTLALVDVSEQIAIGLESAIAKGDTTLQLRGFTVKGDIDLEWDVSAAQHDWERVRQLARDLGDKGWENRANGELGMVAFLKGNTGEASKLVQQALQTSVQSGDIGGQLRYMGAIANGILLAGNAQLAMDYVDRALKIATDHPETGFPYVVYSTKVHALLASNQADQAERFANAAVSEAQSGDHRIKQIELLITLAQIAQNRKQSDRALELYSQAASIARAGHVQRLLADAEQSLADAYRRAGNLVQAQRHASAAVRETEASGSRFTLPVRLGVLAEIYAAQGKVAAADRLYEQATDVVEAIMVNVPSRDAQARLIGVMSDLYAGHFRLAADRLANPLKAYDIIERARGRALADVLRSVPGSDRGVSDAAATQIRAISRLQVRLMRAQVASERRKLLDELWQAEQTSVQRLDNRTSNPAPTTRIPVQRLQAALKPNEALIEYVLTEPRSYCLTITRTAARLVPLPSRAEVQTLADRFVDELRLESQLVVEIQ